VIEQKAAGWLVLADRGLDARQRDEFAVWLQADERHAEIYAEIEETWTRLGRLGETSPQIPRVLAGARLPRRTGKFVWLVPTLTAAAALAIAWVSWWRPVQSDSFSTTASTQVGGLQKLTLPDGSVVQINTDSAVTVEFTARERRIQLVRGEAHFQVTKNPARPFIVSAGVVAVRAVGTAFDVRLRPEAVEVLVTEGKVRVNDAALGKSLLAASNSDGEESLLVAGQRAVVPLVARESSAPAAVVAVPPVEIGQALSWQSRRLEFVATPLTAIVAEFNRYNLHKLVIADPRLASRRFGGTFPSGDYDELVRLLEQDFGVVAERGENETKLRLAP
jgi:transmembrane sensor